MNRREVLAGGAALASLAGTPVLAVDSTVRGVRIGLTSGSLNPLPRIPGKDAADIVVEECVRMGVGNVELASGFFGPAVEGVVRGRAPAVPTPDYLRSREAQRQWRLSPGSLADFRAVRAKFDRAGLNLFSMSNSFFDDCTDAEIDAMFRQMQALGIKLFQTNQTRVPMGPRLKAPAETYGISPANHTHSMVDDPDEVATPASLAKLLAISPAFRVCLDIGHFAAGGNDPVAYLREHHDRITHIHVKDRKRGNGPNVAWGTGDTPIGASHQLIRDNRWPIIALTEREYDGAGTPFEQTKANIETMRAMLNA
jgi:hypothetical protein